YIEIYDAGLYERTLLGRVCNGSTGTFTSLSNTVMVRININVIFLILMFHYILIFDSAERPSCGGLLSNSSGTFHSPFYPGYYGNYVNCVWEIQVMTNYLAFVTCSCLFPRLEGGQCQYNYIEVYDGPLYTSPLLGRICYGSVISYTSSSNLMTVQFHSDYSYTARGFWADYYSIPADQNTTLLCLPEYMKAVVSRAYLSSQGYSAWNVSLNDPYCRPTITPYSVIFDIPYTRCGTRREGNNNTITYTNQITVTSSGYIIKRQKDLHVHVNCKMLQNTWVQVMYVADNFIEINETQYSRYNVNLTFYRSSSFSQPVYDSPYYVDLNQNLFLQAYLYSSDSNLVLFVDTCVASPDPNDFTTVSYDIIRNGCIRDSSYTTYYSGYNYTARFKFNAFQFVNRHPTVYLQCQMVVCPAYDYSSRCYQGCLSRFKRDAGSSHEKVTVVVGPIQLQGDGTVGGCSHGGVCADISWTRKEPQDHMHEKVVYSRVKVNCGSCSTVADGLPMFDLVLNMLQEG
uniref:CUB and zona pellucida like domains 1 n=1 Tax=Crocodylus porosus TaxID=8502 RepID=A0A7M4EV45_CROPO